MSKIKKQYQVWGHKHISNDGGVALQPVEKFDTIEQALEACSKSPVEKQYFYEWQGHKICSPELTIIEAWIPLYPRKA
jgi:hypothetical protein